MKSAFAIFSVFGYLIPKSSICWYSKVCNTKEIIRPVSILSQRRYGSLIPFSQAIWLNILMSNNGKFYLYKICTNNLEDSIDFSLEPIQNASYAKCFCDFVFFFEINNYFFSTKHFFISFQIITKRITSLTANNWQH